MNKIRFHQWKIQRLFNEKRFVNCGYKSNCTTEQIQVLLNNSNLQRMNTEGTILPKKYKGLEGYVDVDFASNFDKGGTLSRDTTSFRKKIVMCKAWPVS